MSHVWVRAEQRPNERRVGLTPEGAAALVAAGHAVTIEESETRALPLEPYLVVGAEAAPVGSWPDAPDDAWIFGLKELPDDETPLRHRHIMFGHAYKGQPDGARLLHRFAAGGGALYDLEYLVDEDGRRVAAFGYWAGYVGAGMSLACHAAQRRGEPPQPGRSYASAAEMLSWLRDLLGDAMPTTLIIGAHGRTGRGAANLCAALGIAPTLWDMAETAHGGPFPEILEHEIVLNCILAGPETPVFVPSDAGRRARRLTVIGDIACDPTSDFSPIRAYDRPTSWERPALRVHEAPPLDVMAIDNLPSMLPAEASRDFAAQLLPSLLALPDGAVWERALQKFRRQAPATP
ncbi:saccharopine dehydrogenase [Roseitranquillus sediminis]|uniref:saccharopine dehydrogenase n=1 Tax=Roseitranquillus sediminis TaxID=2809051 RepID=UPI001D0C2404|nr:saccharopine dehydrogenase [Roseitranquillus sediminis]MBM9593662.1 saccharopine dehydrogenase [Roseitranquillus sediminis]